MSGILSGGTNKFYGTMFNEDTALGKFNRLTDPVTAMVADDAIEKTTPLGPAAIPPPLTMPDEQAAKDAKRRKIATLQAGSGRQSTIYTDDGNAKLGG